MQALLRMRAATREKSGMSRKTFNRSRDDNVRFLMGRVGKFRVVSSVAVISFERHVDPMARAVVSGTWGPCLGEDRAKIFTGKIVS